MDKVLVQDKECEMAVIGVLLQYPTAFDDVSDILTADVFTTPLYADIYGAIKAIREMGETADVITVSAYLQKHHPVGSESVDFGVLAEITEAVCSSIGFRNHCIRLHELWQRRRLWMIGQKLINAGTCEFEDVESIKQNAVEMIKETDDLQGSKITALSAALDGLWGIISDNRTGRQGNGIETGFRELDKRGGMMRSDLMVIAAEFSQGKTSLAIDFAVSAAMKGFPVAFYSTEMTETQLTARILAARSGISSRDIMQKSMNEMQMAAIQEVRTKINDLPIFFDDTSTLSVERIISSIRMMARKRHIVAAFIDYLQVLQTNEKSMGRTEEQFFGLVTRRLKNLAKELNICIVLISQLARSRESPEPTLSRLRGSGQIAEAADVVLLIYRPEMYGKRYTGEHSKVSPSGTALIKIAKGRNIGTGEFVCGYDAPITHFYELDSVPMGNDEAVNTYDEDRPF